MSQQQQNEIDDLRRRVVALEATMRALLESARAAQESRPTLSLKKQNG